jgi:CHAD domain-containing protein
MGAISKWVEASRSEPVFHVAAQSLEARLLAVLHYLPLAAKSAEDDTEHVHQLRVWTRRATAAIRLYRDLVPWSRAVRLRDDLSRLRRAAGEARDYDVLAGRLEKDASDPGAAKLLTRVRALRAQAQQPLLDIFDRLDHGDKFERRLKKFVKKVRQRARTDKLHSTPFGRWARTAIRGYVDQFLLDGQADFSSLEALHQFRISGKKLRYTMELLAAAFPPRFRRQLYGRVESLQDRLGRINDLATAQARYAHWLNEAADPAEIAYLQQQAASEREELEQTRLEFLAWWTAARNKRLADSFDRLILRRKHRGEITDRLSG